MGLFDMFGVGGGDVELSLASGAAQLGGFVEGTAVFKGGKRAQQVQRVVVKLVCVVSTKKHDPQYGWQTVSDSTDIVPETPISEAFTSQPQQQLAFPFRLAIPQGAPASIPEQVAWTVHASADIDGEIDPSASAELIVTAASDEPMPRARSVLGGLLPSAPARPLRWPEACGRCGAPVKPPAEEAGQAACAFCGTPVQPVPGDV